MIRCYRNHRRIGVITLLIIIVLNIITNNEKEKASNYHSPEVTNKVLHLILWTQCRSGSNFIGDFLATSKRVFYWEEPVKFWIKNFNGSLQEPKVSRFIDSLLQCKFYEYPIWDRLRKEHLNYNRDLIHYILNFSQLEDSFDMHLFRCKSSHIRLLRIVHPNLGYALPLLKNSNLNVKIIYDVRDPRGITASRKKLREDNNFDMDLDTPQPCDRLKQDVPFVKKLLTEYPDRFLMIRYEDVCFNPRQLFEKIFTFAGMKITYIQGLTLEKNTRSHNTISYRNPLSTSRFSKDLPQKWKKQLSQEVIQEIQSQCGNEMVFFNYTLQNKE